MQPLGLKSDEMGEYYARLFGSHDFRIDVDVLDLNENPVGSCVLLDGQVNLQDATNLVRRTASLTVSDIDGALDFTEGSKWSGSTIWVDRLVRVQHTIHVPALGRDVTVTPFIGPPSTITRNGPEVDVELQDKTALAIRGAAPYTAPRGMNAAKAIQAMLATTTGEFRFRLGTHARRLSKAYSAGWTDDASPWIVAARIAHDELGMQLIMSCDGYVTLRTRPTSHGIVVPHVTALPSDTVDFTTLSNWVRVTGKQSSKTKGSVTTTTQPVATAVVKQGALSPARLVRQGVPRYLPLIVDASSYTKTSQVEARAAEELDNASRLQGQPAFTCVPFFHGDADDLALFRVPGNDVTARLVTTSIPLGVSGEMSVGTVAWVSSPPRNRTHGGISRTVTVKKSKHKKGRKH